MIKVCKNFTSFSELKKALADIGINDPVIKEYLSAALNNENIGYKETLEFFIDTVANDLPGYFNPEYPNCHSLNIANSYIGYVHGTIGFGINVFVGRTITFSLSIVFYNRREVIAVNPIYLTAIDAGFVEEEKKPYSKFKKNDKRHYDEDESVTV